MPNLEITLPSGKKINICNRHQEKLNMQEIVYFLAEILEKANKDRNNITDDKIKQFLNSLGDEFNNFLVNFPNVLELIDNSSGQEIDLNDNLTIEDNIKLADIVSKIEEDADFKSHIKRKLVEKKLTPETIEALVKSPTASKGRKSRVTFAPLTPSVPSAVLPPAAPTQQPAPPTQPEPPPAAAAKQPEPPPAAPPTPAAPAKQPEPAAAPPIPAAAPKQPEPAAAPPTPAAAPTQPIPPKPPTPAAPPKQPVVTEKVADLGKKEEYDELYNITIKHKVKLPLPARVESGYIYGRNPIAKFLEDPEVDDKLKSDVKIRLRELEDTGGEAEKRRFSIERLERILNYPGWGVAIDHGEERLNQIVNAKITLQEAQINIAREIARVKEVFKTSDIEGMEYITNNFVQKYKGFLIARYKYLKRGGTKPRPFPPICLDGPPGTGKTSIAKVIAEALNISYYMHDVTNSKTSDDINGRGIEWQGGGNPGLIAKAKSDPQEGKSSKHVLLLIDELEKTTPDVLNALGAPLAVGTTSKVHDNYFGVPLSTEGIFFIGTSNGYDLLPAHMKLRMRRIAVPAFSLAKKQQIINKWVDKNINNVQDAGYTIEFPAALQQYFLKKYCYEPGARLLIGMLDAIQDALNAELFSSLKEGQKITHTLTQQDIDKYLNDSKYQKLNHKQIELAEWTEKFEEILSKLNTVSDVKQKSTLRQQLVVFGNEIIDQQDHIIENQKEYDPDYISFITKGRTYVTGLVKFHNNKNLSYLLKEKDHNHSPEERAKLLITKLEAKKELLADKKSQIELQIEYLNQSLNKTADYQTEALINRRKNFNDMLFELDHKIQTLNLRLDLEHLKSKDPAEQKQEIISSELIQRFKVRLTEIEKSLIGGRLSTKKRKKLQQQQAQIIFDLGYMQDLLNPNAAKTRALPKKYTGKSLGTDLATSLEETTTPPAPFTLRASNRARYPIPKDPTEIVEDQEHTAAAKSLINHEDLKEEYKFSQHFLAHLQYKQQKFMHNPEKLNEAFGGIERKLAADNPEGFHSTAKQDKRAGSKLTNEYPRKSGKPQKNLENLKHEEQLYQGWQALSPTATDNAQEITIQETSAAGAREYKLSKQQDSNTLRITSKISHLNDAMITQMVEAQKRAGKTIITINGLCKPRQSEEQSAQGLTNAIKFSQAAQAIGLAIKFDDYTQQKITEKNSEIYQRKGLGS